MDYRRTSKTKVPLANILRQQHAIGRPATGIQTVKEAFQLLITQEMILLLVRETSRRAHLIKDWGAHTSDTPGWATTAYTIKGIGILVSPYGYWYGSLPYQYPYGGTNIPIFSWVCYYTYTLMGMLLYLYPYG